MKKITTLTALHVSFTICFCLCLFWLGGNFKLCCLIYLFFQNLTFQNWYSAYLHVRLIHRLLRYWYIIMIISCKYTTRLIKCTMFLLIIMIIIIILQRSGDWTIPFPWCCWYVLEKLWSLVLRFWKSLSSCFCWTTVLWNALKAVKFIIDFIFHYLLNSIMYLVLNRTSKEPSTAFSRYAWLSEVENALETVNGDINEAAGVILHQSVRGL